MWKIRNHGSVQVPDQAAIHFYPDQQRDDAAQQDRPSGAELLADANWDPELANGVSEDVALLLAAGHRYDEARAALAKNESSGAEGFDGTDYRRFVRRLTRWMDDGGIIPDPDRAPLSDLGVAQVFTPGASLEEVTGWLEQALDARETRATPASGGR